MSYTSRRLQGQTARTETFFTVERHTGYIFRQWCSAFMKSTADVFVFIRTRFSEFFTVPAYLTGKDPAAQLQCPA